MEPALLSRTGIVTQRVLASKFVRHLAEHFLNLTTTAEPRIRQQECTSTAVLGYRLENIHIDRVALARSGIPVSALQDWRPFEWNVLCPPAESCRSNTESVNQKLRLPEGAQR